MYNNSSKPAFRADVFRPPRALASPSNRSKTKLLTLASLLAAAVRASAHSTPDCFRLEEHGHPVYVDPNQDSYLSWHWHPGETISTLETPMQGPQVVRPPDSPGPDLQHCIETLATGRFEASFLSLGGTDLVDKGANFNVGLVDTQQIIQIGEDDRSYNWQIKTPNVAGPWSVKLTTDQGTSLLSFQVEVLSACPRHQASLLVEAPLWPGSAQQLIDVPIHRQWNPSRRAPDYENCEVIEGAPVTDLVAISTDRATSNALALSDSAVSGHTSILLDPHLLDVDQPEDTSSFVSVLEKRANIYSVVSQAQVQLVDCPRVFLNTGAANLEETDLDDDQMAIKLVTKADVPSTSPGQEQTAFQSGEESRDVRFVFFDSKREAMAAKCLEKIPSNMVLRCEQEPSVSKIPDAQAILATSNEERAQSLSFELPFSASKFEQNLNQCRFERSIIHKDKDIAIEKRRLQDLVCNPYTNGYVPTIIEGKEFTNYDVSIEANCGQSSVLSYYKIEIPADDMLRETTNFAKINGSNQVNGFKIKTTESFDTQSAGYESRGSYNYVLETQDRQTWEAQVTVIFYRCLDPVTKYQLVFQGQTELPHPCPGCTWTDSPTQAQLDSFRAFTDMSQASTVSLYAIPDTAGCFNAGEHVAYVFTEAEFATVSQYLTMDTVVKDFTTELDQYLAANRANLSGVLTLVKPADWATNNALELTVKAGVTYDDLQSASLLGISESENIAAKLVIAHVYKDAGTAKAAKMFSFSIEFSCAHLVAKEILPLVLPTTGIINFETASQPVTFMSSYKLKYDDSAGSVSATYFDTTKEFTWTASSTVANWPCGVDYIPQVKVSDFGPHTYTISTSLDKDTFESPQVALTFRSDVPDKESDTKLQTLQLEFKFLSTTFFTGYLDIMVGLSTLELAQTDSTAGAPSTGGVIKVARELVPTLELTPNFFYAPEQGNHFGTIEEGDDRVQYQDSWVPTYTSATDLSLQPITKETGAQIRFVKDSWQLYANYAPTDGIATWTFAEFDGDLDRDETWQIASETVVASTSLQFEDESIFTAEYVEMIVDKKDGIIPEILVPMNIHGDPAPQESFSSSQYRIDYKLIKQPEPFMPYPWAVVTWTTASQTEYQIGDSILSDTNFDKGVINSVLDASPDLEDSVELSSGDWNGNDVLYRCQPWTLELQGKSMDTSFYVSNSQNADIKALVHATCINAPCENRIALEQGHFEFPDQMDEFLLNIFPLVHYPAVRQEQPEIESYCGFTKVQELQRATVTLANGAAFEVSQEQLSAEYGINLSGNIIEMQTDDSDLYGANFDLVIKDTVIEEPTWFNTTHFSFQYTKPPCVVTTESIENSAGGLSFRLLAKKAETTDQIQTQAYYSTIVQAFNQTEEFWCGPIDSELVSDGDYLTFEKSSNLLVLNPTENDPIGNFKAELRYFYIEYPEKQLSVPIDVTIEGCDDDQLQFDQKSVTLDIVVGRPNTVTIPAPLLEARASCAGAIEATYTLLPLSVPMEATGLEQFFAFDPAKHTFIIQPMKDIAMLGKAVSGTFKASPEGYTEIFTVEVSVQFVTNGPEFEQMTDEEKIKRIPKITCSDADREWIMRLPPLLVDEGDAQVKIELLEETGISKLFTLGVDGRVTIKDRHKDKVANGDLCPDVDSFELEFKLTSELLGTSTQTLTVIVEPAKKDIQRASFKGVDPDTVFLQTREEGFKQPEIAISSISFTGELVLSFSEEFLVPNDLTRLKAKDFTIEGRKRSNLELIIAPVEGQTDEDVQFNWEIISFKQQKLTLQLNFEKPYMVSQASEINTIQVKVWDPSLFIRQKDKVPIAPLTQLTSNLPKVVEKTTAEVIMETAFAFATTGKTGVVFIFLLGFFFNMGMNRLLGQVQNLNIITHLMMMSLKYPMTMSLFFSQVFEFVTFDIIPTEKFYHYFLKLKEEPLSEDADNVGYYSLYILHNAGSITIFLLGYILCQGIFFIMSRTASNGKVLAFAKSKREAFKWAGLVDFYSEVYLPLSFCVCINYTNLQIEDVYTGINNVFCVVVSIFLLIGPALINFGLYRAWDEYVPPHSTSKPLISRRKRSNRKRRKRKKAKLRHPLIQKTSSCRLEMKNSKKACKPLEIEQPLNRGLSRRTSPSPTSQDSLIRDLSQRTLETMTTMAKRKKGNFRRLRSMTPKIPSKILLHSLAAMQMDR